MKRGFYTIIFSFFSAFLIGQNGIIGSGFSSGWSNSGNVTCFGDGAGSSRIYTTTANGTGNQFFRMVRCWNFGGGDDFTEFSVNNPCAGGDIDISGSVGNNFNLNNFNCTTGAYFINVGSTSYNYVFKTRSGGEGTPTFVFFEIQGDVRSVSSGSQNPASGAVTEDDDVVVTATLDAAFNPGQAVFLRYSDDSFDGDTSDDVVIKMSMSTSTTYTATIPKQSAGTVISYYLYTSGDVASISGADSDYFTINLNNNGGSNFSYTVSAAMPVDLIRFEAEKISNLQAKLTWATANEINNDYFEIQRKGLNNSWKVIGKVKGQGTSNGNYYEHWDNQLSSGINYYRLKQVDFNGNYEYSNIISVDNNIPISADIYPNPASDHLFIDLESQLTSQSTVQIFNTSGQLVQQEILQQGTNQQRIDISSLNNGIYWLQITDLNGIISDQKKFIKTSK